MNYPEPNKLVKLYCGEYTAIAKWVPYKDQRMGRYMVRDESGRYNPDTQIKYDVEHWEYLPDPKTE